MVSQSSTPQDDVPLHSVAVVAVVTNDESNVLLIRRADNGEWALPGGVVERDELPTDAVIRETLEETGVSIEIVGLAAVFKNMRHELRPLSLVWRCRWVAGTVRSTDESSRTEWLPVAQALSRLSPLDQARLQDGVAGSADLPVRAHDGRRLAN